VLGGLAYEPTPRSNENDESGCPPPVIGIISGARFWSICPKGGIGFDFTKRSFSRSATCARQTSKKKEFPYTSPHLIFWAPLPRPKNLRLGKAIDSHF